MIDVRNGYRYGHVALDETEVRKNRTSYSDDDAIAAAEWKARS